MTKTLLEKVDGIDRLSRDLHKIESQLRSGQIIGAWRAVCGLIADLERAKRSLIEEESKKSPNE